MRFSLSLSPGLLSSSSSSLFGTTTFKEYAMNKIVSLLTNRYLLAVMAGLFLLGLFRNMRR
jgi:hypothetical protein